MAHIAIYFLALFSLSTSPNWAKLNQMPPEVLGFWRLGIAATLLLIYLFYKNRLGSIKNLLKFPINHNVFWILASGFFFFLHLWTYKYAAKNTLVSNTMIIFATNPVWASLGGVLFFKEKLKGRVILSYILAFGALTFFLYKTINFSPEQKWGNWSAAISALFYVIYMMTGKKAREKADNIDYAFLQYATCAICFGLASLVSGASFLNYTGVSWFALAGLVLIPTFLGHMILTHLVKSMDLSLLTCGKLIEPVLASIMAYFLFQENLIDGAWVAFAMTTTAVLILFWPEKMKVSV